ncbi:MAG: CotH kinase family protein [Lachnospiraceae bacterium]|nr:CotH kinase family protein [Lachnospiraceae bacterium]
MRPDCYRKPKKGLFSKLYVPETPVHKGTVVKARVIVPDTGEMSPVVSAVYFVGMEEWEGYGDLPVMSLTIDPKDLFDDTHGIYVTGDVYRNYLARTDADHMWEPYVLPANFTREGRGWERPVIMDYFSPSHEHLLTQSAGIRIHGGWSTAFNQKSFNLYAREEYDGSAVFRYPFFGRTYSKLMLRNGGVRDIYATKLRDVFLQSLMSDRACDIQEGEPCIVFINGEYWGLYNLQEPVGDRYIETRYGIPREDVIFLKTEESNTGLPQDMEMYDDLVAYAALHDMADEEAYAYIANRIDIDSYIDYFCFLIYVADCDSVGNNFARWRARTASGGIADGRWRYVLYDTDDSAGIQSLLTRYHVDSFAAGMHGVSPMDDPLFAALLRNDAYKEKFVTTFMDLANYNFSYDIVHEKLAETAAVYKDQVVLSQQRFRGYFTMDDVVEGLPYTGNYTPEHFDADVAIIDEFFANRKEYIVSHMIQSLRLASGPVTITLRAHAQADIVLNTLTLSATGQDWQGEYFPQYPVTLTCIPREGAAFDHWEVNGVAVSYEETFETRVSAGMVIRCVIK